MVKAIIEFNCSKKFFFSHLATAIIAFYFAVPTSVPDLQLATTLEIITIVAVIVVVAALLLAFMRIIFCRIEREVTRFVISIICSVSLLVILYAVVVQAPSLFITIFFFVMLLREILYFVVDNKFYRKFYTPTRKRISNTIITIIFIVLYVVEVALGLFIIAEKVQSSSWSGLF